MDKEPSPLPDSQSGPPPLPAGSQRAKRDDAPPPLPAKGDGTATPPALPRKKSQDAAAPEPMPVSEAPGQKNEFLQNAAAAAAAGARNATGYVRNVARELAGEISRRKEAIALRRKLQQQQAELDVSVLAAAGNRVVTDGVAIPGGEALVQKTERLNKAIQFANQSILTGDRSQKPEAQRLAQELKSVYLELGKLALESDVSFEGKDNYARRRAELNAEIAKDQARLDELNRNWAAASKDKKRRLLIGAAAASVLLLAVGILIFSALSKSKDPTIPAEPVVKNEERPLTQLSAQEVYRRMLPSTVWIRIRVGNFIGSGSGVLVNAKERLILTNFHVVDGTDAATVFFPAYKETELVTRPAFYVDNAPRFGIPGKVVLRDSKRDLALIQLESLPDETPAINLASRGSEPGQTLYSVGASGVILQTNDGTLWRYTTGQVRQVYEHSVVYEKNQRVSAWTVETQAPTNRGDSGGPVANDYGQLVALVSGGSKEERLVSINIDLREIRAFLDEYARASTNPKSGANKKP